MKSKDKCSPTKMEKNGGKKERKMIGQLTTIMGGKETDASLPDKSIEHREVYAIGGKLLSYIRRWTGRLFACKLFPVTICIWGLSTPSAEDLYRERIITSSSFSRAGGTYNQLRTCERGS